MPFTVTIDDQGRLTELKINGSTDLAADFQISNLGSPTPVTAPPASQVVPAPAAVYKILND